MVLWRYLVGLSQSQQSAMHSGDRINGYHVTNAETRDFLECIVDCDMMSYKVVDNSSPVLVKVLRSLELIDS